MEIFDTTVPWTELVDRGWYHARSGRWVEVPRGHHHSSIVVAEPETFDWDDVFDFTPDQYAWSYEQSHKVPPDFDDMIIGSMIEHGWVRVGSVPGGGSRSVYVTARDKRDAQKAIRFYTRRVIDADLIDEIRVDYPSGDHEEIAAL